MKYNYNIFGLNFESFFPFYGLQENKNNCADVYISQGKVVDHLNFIKSSGICYEQNENEFLLTIANVAKYYVSCGRYIVIEFLTEDIYYPEILLFLMSSVIISLLEQRKYITIHGSAVANEKNNGIMFIGDSGVGKSTISYAMYKKGYRFITDEICAIKIKNNKAFIYQDFGYIKLWTNTLQKFDEELSKLKRARKKNNYGKYLYNINNYEKNPTIIKNIFIINSHNKNSFDTIRLENIKAINIVTKNSFNNMLLKDIGDKKNQYNCYSVLANQCKIYKINRPHNGFLLNDFVKKIEECL